MYYFPRGTHDFDKNAYVEELLSTESPQLIILKSPKFLRMKEKNCSRKYL